MDNTTPLCIFYYYNIEQVYLDWSNKILYASVSTISQKNYDIHEGQWIMDSENWNDILFKYNWIVLIIPSEEGDMFLKFV